MGVGEQCFLVHQPLRGAKLTSGSLHGRVNHRQAVVAATYAIAPKYCISHLPRYTLMLVSALRSLGPAITFTRRL
jgi:hypothetical protein